MADPHGGLRYLGPIRPDRHPVTMGCSIAPLTTRPATAVPVLLLLEEAIDAMTAHRPLCPQRLPLHDGPSSPVLSCDLPADHHSPEHYDRATGAVWIPDDAALPTPLPMPDNAAWPDDA